MLRSYQMQRRLVDHLCQLFFDGRACLKHHFYSNRVSDKLRKTLAPAMEHLGHAGDPFMHCIQAIQMIVGRLSLISMYISVTSQP
jgi:hypothetical protein